MPDRQNLLLVPSLLCDARLWQNQTNALKDIADCTIADTTRYGSMAIIASDILQSAPPKFALAGLSMGGYVALEIMRQAPERVTKLAILSSSARADTPEQQNRRRLSITLSQAGNFKGVTPRLLPSILYTDHIQDTALTELIMAMARELGREVFTHQQTAILNRIDSRPFLKEITCPTMVIAGQQDVMTPPELAREIADGVAGAALHIIDKCGHLPPLEQAETVNKLMRDWLSA